MLFSSLTFLLVRWFLFVGLRHSAGGLRILIQQPRPNFVFIQYYAGSLCSSAAHRARRANLICFD